MKKKSRDRISLPYIVLLIFIGVPIIVGTSAQYIAIFSVLALLVVFNFTFRIRIRDTLDKLPLYFLGVWFFGVIVGFISGNSRTDIFSNFAGMLVYLLAVVLLNAKRFNIYYLYRALYVASILVSIEIILVFGFRISGITPPWPLVNIRYISWRSTIYAGISVMVFVLEAISLWNAFHATDVRSRIMNIILFGMSTFSILATTDSGGFALGYVVILGVVMFLSLSSKRMSRSAWIFSILFFMAIIIAAVIYESQTGTVNSIFSLTSSGNGKRYYQFQLVAGRFKLFGNGLGSHLNYGYGTRLFDSYGLEISYLNLIDKFGIFGFLLIFVFLYTFIKPIIMIKRGQGNTFFNLMAIGLQGYLFVAMGNPVIFAPYNVVMHVFAILLLSYSVRSEQPYALSDPVYAGQGIIRKVVS